MVRRKVRSMWSGAAARPAGGPPPSPSPRQTIEVQVPISPLQGSAATLSQVRLISSGPTLLAFGAGDTSRGFLAFHGGQQSPQTLSSTPSPHQRDSPRCLQTQPSMPRADPPWSRPAGAGPSSAATTPRAPKSGDLARLGTEVGVV